MTTPPAAPGWYADPKDPRQQRWWDGTRWTEFTTAWAQTTDTPFPPLPTPTPDARGGQATKRWRPSLTTWIVAAIAVLLALIGATRTGFGGFLIVVALFGVGAGVYTLATRRAGWLNLPRTKGAGGAALGISVAVLLLGALVAPRPVATELAGGQSDGAAISAQSGTGQESVADPTRASEPTATPKPTATSKPTSTPRPAPSLVMVDVPEAIAFGASTYEDPNVDVGTNVVVTAGVAGQKVTRWELTVVDGVETARRLVSETVTVAPVDEVTAIGTRQPPPPPAPEPEPQPEAAAPGGGCDPNYAGACVPIDSDVDCAGGSGNGPSYVRGPVQVIGSDIYDLDRDGDGIACD
ncbi:G5 domain-containing protein [Herbiconiux sp. A18JL235]|uniref:G5 domain-containing protein n=1 Tax=Herbiconiux sp. A18JL235 TaxID=3152363 RepID=A0AB39BDP6_9MICO